MDTFIVHVSDAGIVDEKFTVKATQQTLGKAVGAAIDQLLRDQPAELWLPLFVDVHVAAEFQDREFSYREQVPASALNA